MSNYSFDLITKSGDNINAAGNLVSIGNTPSINNFGSIALIGKFGTGFSAPTDLLVANPSGDISNLSSSDTWRFSNQVQINDNNQVVARDTLAGLFAIRRWDVDLPDAYIVEATGGFPAGGLDFESLYLFQRINNSDDVVFVGDPKDNGAFNQVVATQREIGSSGFKEYNQASVPSAFIKPDIADNGTIVFRDPISTITLNDYQLNPIAVIASSNLGFSSVGLATNISDDGKAVAFYGDLENPDATSTTEGLKAGKGIFLSVETGSGRKIHRIAGIAGNGILDPGETYVDQNSNGELDSGTETDKGLIGGFNFDQPIGVSFNETDNGGYGTVAFLASDENGSESLISSKYNISDNTETIQTNVSIDLVAKVGEPANEVSSDLAGDLQDLSIYDPINDDGQIAFWAKTTTGEEAVVRANPVRKPILIIPGIGGSLPDTEKDFKEWVMNRGFVPDRLINDPLLNTYSDLVESLERAGYTEGVDLFVATHDWRLSPGPIDGVIDGVIERSIADLTDGTYEYSMDQLAFWMNKAEEQWKSQFPAGEPIPELESVDVIAHSAGGSVARSYIQSTAYSDPNFTLPKVNNFITLGVPFRGSPAPYKILSNDFISDPSYAFLGNAMKFARDKVIKKNQTIKITGESNSEIEGVITPDMVSNELSDPKDFLKAYAPNLNALLATYPAIRRVGSVKGSEVVPEEELENKLLLDLNDGVAHKDEPISDDKNPNKFADKYIEGVNEEGLITGQVKVVHSTGLKSNEESEVNGNEKKFYKKKVEGKETVEGI